MRMLSIMLILLCCLLTSVFNVSVQTAYADTINFSDVLDDLKQDLEFKLEDYLSDEKDNSLQVIQIAEGANKELFVYVYQPLAEVEFLQATTINISTEERGLKYFNYKLKFLNSEGTLHKYKVENFTVKEDKTRIYNISSIFRAWNKDLDDEPENGNTVSEVPFEVGQLWTVVDTEMGVKYDYKNVETIEVTSKYVGLVRYSGGFEPFGWSEGCDSHFVAFSTNKPIDRLLEADVYYTTQKYFGYLITDPFNFNEVFDEKQEQYVYLDYKLEASFKGDGWFADPHIWKRITTVSDFIKNENTKNVYHCGAFNVVVENQLTEQGKKDLEGKQWILRFAETKYDEEGTTAFHSTEKTIVGDVSILRLTYTRAGKVYNVGVIDNKQTGDGIPDNETRVHIELPDWLIYLLLIALFVGAIIALAIFAPNLLIAGLNLIITVGGKLCNAIWWLITAPFEIFK